MSDHIERACHECGSLLHHEYDCQKQEAEVIHYCSPSNSCGGWFVCAGCLRVVGWCLGAYDDMAESCDECANLEHGVFPELVALAPVMGVV